MVSKREIPSFPFVFLIHPLTSLESWNSTAEHLINSDVPTSYLAKPEGKENSTQKQL